MVGKSHTTVLAWLLCALECPSMTMETAVSHGHSAEAKRCPSDTLQCEDVEATASKTVSLLQVHRTELGASKESVLPAMRHPSEPGPEPYFGIEYPDDVSPANRDAEKESEKSATWAAPCSCAPDSLSWAQPSPREPRCLFIDLGAADGNTFKRFLKNGYGDVRNCPSGGKYEAILVEANPMFDKELMKLQANFSGKVRSLVSSAAYMCEGFTSFYLDTVDVKQNYWGSSMSPNTNDVQRSGKKHIRVPLVNVARLLMENALPEDYVLLKVDIEGSEHDIVPCLAQSRAAFLIDAIYVEKHPVEWSLAGASKGALQTALNTLQRQGVVTPEYSTSSL